MFPSYESCSRSTLFFALGMRTVQAICFMYECDLASTLLTSLYIALPKYCLNFSWNKSVVDILKSHYHLDCPNHSALEPGVPFTFDGNASNRGLPSICAAPWIMQAWMCPGWPEILTTSSTIHREWPEESLPIFKDFQDETAYSEPIQKEGACTLVSHSSASTSPSTWAALTS